MTVGTNVQTPMQGVNSSAFIRIPFTVADPTAFAFLNLTMRWSDGYAAWLNGTLISSFAAPSPLLYNSAATQTHSAWRSVREFGGESQRGFLHAGTNILAIQALNNSTGNAVFSMLPTLDGLTTVISAAGYLATPTPGAANGFRR